MPDTMTPDEMFDAIHDLVTCQRERGLTQPEADALEALVLSGRPATRLYAQYVREEASLRRWASGQIDADFNLTDGDDDDNQSSSFRRDPMANAMVLPALHETDSAEDIQEVARVPAVAPPPQQKKNRFDLRSWWFLSTGLAAAVLIGAALIWFRMNRTAPARLEAAVDAQWTGSRTPKSGQPLPAEGLTLASGVAQLHFDNGVSVIIEGPSTFQISSHNSVHLTSGKLSASVPVEGHGFTVTTNSARIVDLGTEFGVEAHDDGTTTVDVFQGRIQAESNSANSPGSPPIILTAGQSGTVNNSGVTLQPQSIPQRFVRSLAADFTSFDVVDLLAGGDGTSAIIGMVLDVASGRLDSTPPSLFKGDHQYHRVVEIPAVDGCFVPDGSPGTMQVDSNGDVFQFPRTNNLGVSRIWANDGSPWAGDKMRMSLGGVNYATGGHRAIHVPSNAAITIDLAVLRRLHPGVNLTSFRAIVGNTSDEGHQSAEVFVLADGQQRFTRPRFTPQDGPAQILVALQPSDRFLTLATTDGGDGEHARLDHLCRPPRRL